MKRTIIFPEISMFTVIKTNSITIIAHLIRNILLNIYSLDELA